MIKVSVFYPSGEGITFDIDYYCNTHMPMIPALVSSCKKIEVDHVFMGGKPGSPPIYIAIGHIYFESMDAFATTFPPHEATLMADIPNFTNATPVFQFSEVKL
jgi:uncharacterized protein (TIGR02118 family)